MNLIILLLAVGTGLVLFVMSGIVVWLFSCYAAGAILCLGHRIFQEGLETFKK